MSPLLFEPITIRGVTFKNRIGMSPMCMHSALADGLVTDFHIVHYGARALGGTGLVMLESTPVLESGLVGPGDIGIWSDSHVPGLRKLTEVIQRFGALAGCQLGHAGRQLGVEGQALAPSAIPFTDNSPVPKQLSRKEIKDIVNAFVVGARRAKAANFDVLEVHCAHGYLLNEFLSPLANHRDDEYGGNKENRYRIVREILDEVRAEWQGPLFVRISTTEYVEGGNTPEDYLTYCRWMKEQGVDVIDCSSGGIAMVKVESYPNYQVPAAELLRNSVDIKTAAVGLVENGRQAEEILRNGRADFVFVGREFLKDPFWPRTAADDLKAALPVPPQYTRYGSNWQRSQPAVPAAALTDL
ncbi:NADPH dehydrogenase NamA [Stenotrophomonas maltophilia]|uniref:NADPH dehydrogenase NamA n=1 Tax=Stenotrophomonas maltophilia TaxID=40324 RepID=UPI0034DB09A3